MKKIKKISGASIEGAPLFLGSYNHNWSIKIAGYKGALIILPTPILKGFSFAWIEKERAERKHGEKGNFNVYLFATFSESFR